MTYSARIDRLGHVRHGGFRTTPVVLIIYVLIVLAGTAMPAETAIRSIRTGIQPKGPRIVVDLDGPSEYGVIRRDGRLYLQVKTSMAGPQAKAGNFPGNSLVKGYTVRESDEGTLLEITIQPGKSEFRHYVMMKPDRIVIDFFPKGQSPPALPQPMGTLPTQAEAHRNRHVPEDNLGLQKAKGAEKGLAETIEVPLTANELVFDSSSKLHGFELSIPEDWRILDGCSVQLVLAAGQWKDPPVPPLDIFLNGFPLRGSSNGRPGNGKATVEYTVPPGVFLTGVNELVLSGEGMTGTEPIRLETDSRILLFARLRQDLRLSDFPGAFVPGDDGGRVLIAIPEGFSLKVYEAGLRLMQELQKEIDMKPGFEEKPLVEFIPFSALLNEASAGTDFSGTHVVFLGDPDSFGPIVSSAFSVPENTGDDAFLSCFLNSEGVPRLFIGAPSAETLLLAAETIVREDMKDDLDTSVQSLSPEEIPGEKEEQGVYHEKGEYGIQLAERDFLFRGEGAHSFSLEVDLRRFLPLHEGSGLGLKVRHSRGLDGGASNVVAAVSGREREPVSLDAEGVGEKMFIVPVFADEGRETVNVAIEVLLKVESGETGSLDRAAWCVLEKDAILFPRPSEKPAPWQLENIGSLVRSRDLDLYVGPATDIRALNMLGNFFFGLKGKAEGIGRISVKNLDTYPGPLREKPSVIFAAAKDLEAASIPIAASYEDAGKTFTTSLSSIPVPPEFERNSVVFQVFPGGEKPFSLVASWSSTIPVSDSFRDALLDGKLEGTVCFMNDAGETLAYRASVSDTHRDVGYQAGGYFVLGILIIVASLILFGLIYLFVKRGNLE